MTGWDWVILYVCAGIGMGEGFRCFRKTHADTPLSKKAWVLSAAIWPFWLVMWILTVLNAFGGTRK